MANEIQLRNPNDLVACLEKKKDTDLRGMLPSHVTPERLIRSVKIAAMQNPKILSCSPESIFKAVYNAAELGLDCSGGVLGQGYLIPYKTTLQFIPGYKGLLDLARRSGDYVTFTAEVIHENDNHKVQYGTDPKIEHFPATGDRGEPILFYATAKSRDGDVQFAVISKDEVDAIRNSSSGYKSAINYKNDHPWISYYCEMGKKTVVRRLIKMLPLSSERLARALAIDNEDNERAHGQPVNTSRSAMMKDKFLPKDEPVDVEATPVDDPVPEPQDDLAPKAPKDGATAFANGHGLNENPNNPGTKAFDKWAADWTAEQEANR